MENMLKKKIKRLPLFVARCTMRNEKGERVCVDSQCWRGLAYEDEKKEEMTYWNTQAPADIFAGDCKHKIEYVD